MGKNEKGRGIPALVELDIKLELTFRRLKPAKWSNSNRIPKGAVTSSCDLIFLIHIFVEGFLTKCALEIGIEAALVGRVSVVSLGNFRRIRCIEFRLRLLPEGRKESRD